jgi:hypothetical protein
VNEETVRRVIWICLGPHSEPPARRRHLRHGDARIPLPALRPALPLRRAH